MMTPQGSLLPSRRSRQSRVKPFRLKFRAHYGQAAYVKSSEPILAAIAGTGGGKTVIGMIDVLMDMAKYPGELWLVVEPTWAMVTRILLTSSPGRPSLLHLIKQIDPSAFYLKADNAIYSKIGTVFLGSAQNPMSLEGVHVRGAWMDEAGQMSRLAFETVKRRVAAKGGRVKITTTPYNRGWLYKEVHLPARAGDRDIKVINFPSTANPTYSLAAFERAQRTMNPARFRMMHEGGFERPEGMIYGPTADGSPQWDDKLIIPPFPIPADWWQGAGVDFGWNHPTGAGFVARSPDDQGGIYYLTHDYKKGESSMATHANALKKISSNGANPQRWVGDPAAAQERKELRTLGIPIRLADNTVMAGIETVGGLMATGRFFVFDTCHDFIDEVEGYIWDTKFDEFIDKPVKLNDDVMDAVRYIVHTEEKSQGVALHV